MFLVVMLCLLVALSELSPGKLHVVIVQLDSHILRVVEALWLSLLGVADARAELSSGVNFHQMNCAFNLIFYIWTPKISPDDAMMLCYDANVNVMMLMFS